MGENHLRMRPAFFNFPPLLIRQISAIHPQGIPEEGCLRAVEPDYKPLITNAALRRRMSRIVKMGVACGLACLKELPAAEVGGILTATGWGFLGDTQKFMDALLDNHEQLLNPTPFMQSTFNTIGAQIALCKGIHACNMTYVQKGHSFENALLDAALHIMEGKENLLVGAFDEVTPLSEHVLRGLGMKMTMGEGAQFFLLQSLKNGSRVEKNGTCFRKNGAQDIFLLGVDLFTGKYTPSAVYDRAIDFLAFYQLSVSDIDFFLEGRTFPAEPVTPDSREDSGDNNASYDYLAERFATSVDIAFKKECGEYPTAVSYALWKACCLLQESSDDRPFRIVVYNHFLGREHTFLLVSNVCGQ